jgi:YidC/Oxa1 family membrane protein insertase
MENNKRVLLAVALCLGILLAWQHFFPKYSLMGQPSNPQEQAQSQAQPQAQSQPRPQARPQTPAEASMAAAEPLAGQPVTVTTPHYKAVINTAGGILEHFSLNDYKLSIAPDSPDMDLIAETATVRAPMGVIVDGQPTWQAVKWTTQAQDVDLGPGQSATLTFTGQMAGLTLERQLTFKAATYLVEETLTLTSQTGGSAKVAFTLAGGSLTGGEANYNPTQAVYLEGKSIETMKDLAKLKDGKVIDSGGRWVGLESNYFIMALLPQGESVLKLQHTDDVTRMAAEKESVNLPQGQPVKVLTAYYLGPKTPAALAVAPDNLQAAIDYGWFHVVAEGLLWLLRFLHQFVGNWGLDIMILTMFIKLIFWPLSQKSYRSMEKMRKLQPMMAAIREKYPDDRNKMNEELMQLYKTYKVNPAGGCLPVVVQIPVFFGLYQALLNAIELRHASFIHFLPFTHMVWLADLSAKDPYYITPLVMGATMFLQQKMTPAPGDPTQAKIMMFMPVIFTFMFLNFPAGLVIYWLVNNVLSIAQQWMLMRSSRTAVRQKA